MFQDATKIQAKLRATLDGVSGSGKTYSSLMLARELVGPDGTIGLIDTEAGSASKYAKKFAFKTVILGDYSIASYDKAIAAAVEAKFDALIIDSLSHLWAGKGGVLEKVDEITARSKSGNAFVSGWKDMTPQHNAFFERLIAVPMHLICTMRKKSDWVLADNGRGKIEPKKVGMATVQRDGVEYEFDVVADFDLNGNITISKTRCEELTELRDSMSWKDVPKMGQLLKAWLSDGAAQPAPKPVIATPAPKVTSTAVPIAGPVDIVTAVAGFNARIIATTSMQELSKLALELAKQPEAVRIECRKVYAPHVDKLKAEAAGKAA